MKKYIVFCKSYYKKKNRIFVDTKKEQLMDRDLYEKENGIIKIYGCGGSYELKTDTNLNYIPGPFESGKEDKRLRIYLLPKCDKCGFCPQNGNPRIEAELIEEETQNVKIDWSFDYYQALRLDPGCSDKDITKRYREYCLKFRADKYTDKSQAEKRVNHNRFTDIGKAYEVLGNSVNRNRYDREWQHMTFQCPGCLVKGLTKAQAGGGGVKKSNSSLRYFHSESCAKNWNRSNGYSRISVHGWTEQGDEGRKPKKKPENNLPQVVCAGCKTKKGFSHHFWKRWSESSKEDYCCGDKCLFDYWTSKGKCPDGKNPRQCFFCGITRTKNSSTKWVRETDPNSKVRGLIFCSKEHLKEQKEKMNKGTDLGGFSDGSDINKKRRDFIKKLVGLADWDKLSDSEQNNFVNKVNNSQPNQFNAILVEVKNSIKSKGGDFSLNALKNATIAEIDDELLQEPKVNTSELETINQNWNSDIQNATSEEQINRIKEQVLADIRSKRTKKGEISSLDSLLTQARQIENWNNYEKLITIFRQIKKLFSSNASKVKKSEIQAIESQLRELEPEKYREEAKKILDKQVEDNGLTKSNMDNETKQALTEAKQDPTFEKIEKAEKKIAQNGVNNHLKDLIIKTQRKLENSNLSKKEKTKLIDEILQFIKKNDFQALAYQKQKSEVDALLAQLRGEKSHDNTQNSSLKEKALVTLLIISLLGLMIVGILFLRKKKRLKN